MSLHPSYDVLKSLGYLRLARGVWLASLELIRKKILEDHSVWLFLKSQVFPDALLETQLRLIFFGLFGTRGNDRCLHVGFRLVVSQLGEELLQGAHLRMRSYGSQPLVLGAMLVQLCVVPQLHEVVSQVVRSIALDAHCSVVEGHPRVLILLETGLCDVVQVSVGHSAFVAVVFSREKAQGLLLSADVIQRVISRVPSAIASI